MILFLKIYTKKRLATGLARRRYFAFNKCLNDFLYHITQNDHRAEPIS